MTPSRDLDAPCSDGQGEIEPRIEPLHTPRALCLGCDQRPATAGHLCRRCEALITRLCDEIRRGFTRLDATPHGVGAGLDGAQRRPGGYGPRPGARVDVLALTTAPRSIRTPVPGDRSTAVRSASGAPVPGDPVTTAARAQGAPADERLDGPEQPGSRAEELLPTVLAVGRIADQAREDGLIPALRGPRTVGGECLRLSGAQVVVELTGRWWIGWALAELRRAAAAIRAALGEDEPAAQLGPCPRLVPGEAVPALDDAAPDGLGLSAPGVACAGRVVSRDGGESARCTRCHHPWVGRERVLALAGRLDELHLDAAALAAHLAAMGYGTVRVEVLWQWARRDDWSRRGAGRRTTYRLGDALVSARRRRGPGPPSPLSVLHCTSTAALLAGLGVGA